MKALINSQILRANYERVIRLAPDCPVVAMVKANAYGHGLLAVARFFEALGVTKFGVATVEEGETLRDAGISGQILSMPGAGLVGVADRLYASKLTPLISSIPEFEALCALKKTLTVHFDIDTGMSRGGFLWSEAPKIIDAWKKREHQLVLEGLSTHFSDAETELQIERFETVLSQFQRAGLSPTVIHTSKSTAILDGFVTKYPGIETWIRPGIALYDSVMTLKAPVTLIKAIPKGAGVGYDKTWIAGRDTRLALIRAGYADGIPRALSNRGHVEIHGKRAPIVGRVSMDLITLDVTDINCEVGEEVSFMTSKEIAQIAGTIDYEILTGISERVQRVWI